MDCHADVSEVPHPNLPQKVNCRRCHYSGNTAGAPQLEKYVEFEQSVHGKALAAGNPRRPRARTATGTTSSSPARDPRSEVSHTNIPQVCGTLPPGDLRAVRGLRARQGPGQGGHGRPRLHQLPRRAQHPEGRRTSASSVNAGHVANTCAQCHAKVVIMEKYGVKAEQVATYNESFHGIANEFGVLTAANCASCHTAHDILPASDPRSSVNAANIPKTCGKCHAGSQRQLRQGPHPHQRQGQVRGYRLLGRPGLQDPDPFHPGGPLHPHRPGPLPQVQEPEEARMAATERAEGKP